MADATGTDVGAPGDLGLSTQTCPQCGSRLIRIGRRPLDRLLSIFVPVHRYRCPSFPCRWEGCLRVAYPPEPTVPGALPASAEPPPQPPRKLPPF